MNLGSLKFYVELDKFLCNVEKELYSVGFNSYGYIGIDLLNWKDRIKADKSVFAICAFNINDIRLNIPGNVGDVNDLEINGYVSGLDAARGLYEYCTNHNLKHKVDGESLKELCR